MATLSTPVKLHIVTALACFDSPTQVAASVKERFGLVLSRQRIEAWHPERAAGARLDAKWRAVFDVTRARLLAELDGIPLAHRAYRLRRLGRLALQAETMGNVALAARIIEQAAREAGDLYVTRQAPSR